MSREQIQVLLITGDPAEASRLQTMLAETECPTISGPVFTFAWSTGLDVAAENLEREKFDAVLIDLSPSSGIGPEVISRLRKRSPSTAIVALIDRNDPERVSQIMCRGAQDCLIKDQINGPLLRCLLRCAVERQRRENLLLEKDTRYRAMFEYLGTGVAVFQPLSNGEDFIFLDFNPAAERITRVRREQVLGRRLREVFPNVERTPLLDALRRVCRTGQPENLPPFYYEGSSIQGWFEDRVYRLPSGEIFSLFDDVTNRVQVEQALRESWERYRLIADFVYDWEYWVGPDGRILYMSPSCERITGYRPEEFIQDPGLLLRIIHPEDLPRMIQHTSVEMENPEQYTFDFRILTRGGEERWITHRCRCVYGEDGKWLGRRVSNVDITERKRYEEELRQHGLEMALLYEVGQTITSVLEMDRVLERVVQVVQILLKAETAAILLYDAVQNEMIFAAVAGQHAERLKGLRLPATASLAGWALSTGLPVLTNEAYKDPRFVSLMDDIAEQAVRALLAVPLQHMERRIGVLEAINWTDRPFSEHDLSLMHALAGPVATAIVNARLYEEVNQRLSETRVLQEIAQTAASTLDSRILLEQTLEIIHRNFGVEVLCFLTLDETGEGLVASCLYANGLRPPAEKLRIPLEGNIFGRAWTSGQPVLLADTEGISLFPPPVGVEIRSAMAVPVRSGESILGVLGAATSRPAGLGEKDLHLFEAIAAQIGIALEKIRLYQAEREYRQFIEQTQAQFIQTEKMAALGRLVAAVSHEINNPLQSLQGCMALVQEMMAEGANSEEVAEYVDLAIREIDRIAQIMSRLREFYRPSQTGLCPTNIHSLIEDILLLCNRKFQHSKVRVELELDSDLPLIQAHPDQLKQVFLNLVLNALDAMPNGGTLRIRTGLEEIRTGVDVPPRPAVCIQFSDTGIGMSPEVAARAFEPFFTTKPGGTGLGLPISHAIITAHRGQITLSSQEGAGTTFTILLPVEPL